MKRFYCLAGFVFLVCFVFAQEDLPKDYLTKEFHAGRRDALRRLMPSNSVAVIFSYPLRTFSKDVDYPYHQNPDLHYFSGYKAGYLNTTGTTNHFEGYLAGYSNTTGGENHFSGFAAGYKNNNGGSNTYLGYQSGHENISGSGNVMIGHLAGYNETGSNKLYISNSSTANPLIYGDFANQVVKLTANLQVKKGLDNNNPVLRLTDMGSHDMRVIYESVSYPYYWATISSGDEINSTPDFSFFYSHYAENAGRPFVIMSNGDAEVGGTLYQLSDQRLKKNINSITGSLNKIKQFEL